MFRAIATACLLGASFLVATPFAAAQYFGQNKVQYEDLDFQVLHTDHFDIYFYPEEEEATRIAAEMAERWYARLSRILDHELTGIQPLILYASHPHFQQTNVIAGVPGVGTGGVTESLKRRITMPFAGPLAETDHVLGHELVHAFQYDISAQAGPMAAGLRLPLWFIEGMAEYLSLGPVSVLTSAWMREAALRDELPTIQELSDPRFFPYRYGHAFWAYVGGRFGDETVGQILRVAADRGSAVGGIESVLQVDAESLSEEWHRSVRETYQPLLNPPRTASDFGRPLLTDTRDGGEVNVAPSISPDGSRVVFLSERDLFSIDLFLADATTGEVTEKLIETAADPHFDNLQFIQSSGSWSPQGDRFVVAALSQGQPVLVFLDAEDGDVVEEIEFAELGEIYNPSWSPDGRRIVFSAITGGLLDLHLFDLETRERQPLTSDLFAELHPSWSPDGARVVFVTDRFGPGSAAPSQAHYELATMEIPSRNVERLALFPGADHWNPQWTGDGLYFVSDRGGIPNVYRLDLARGGISQITALSTGVHGITLLSPAITASADGNRLLFTVQEEDQYRVYSIDEPETLRGSQLAAGDDDGLTATWAVLPPVPRSESAVASMLQAPVRNLAQETYPMEAYDPSLQLDYVGQPYLVAGSNRFSSFIGGGISFLWSDMLGNHQLGTQVQINGDFEDFAGIVGYENRASRWNWGGSVSVIPFRSGQFFSGLAEIDGELAQVEQLITFRQSERRVGGFIAYPFSRAQRLELGAGFTNYGFSREAETFAISLETGNVIVDENVDLEAPGSINVGTASTALVYDTALIGPTSPLLGTRYRFEGGASYGTLSYGDVLLDFRRYFMPAQPFTFAVRGLHFGRYGGDAEDPRLRNLYLGYPNLVRGYQAGSFSADECAADGGCTVFDRLLGSRLAVANVEFRFPLFSLFGAEPWGGPLPIELAFFGDAGVAWSSDDSPEIFGGDREAVTSAGVALRLAVQRFLVLQFDFVRPFERTEKGWIFEFNIQPGF